VTTGSELRKPGESLARGEIYESNGILLSGMCAAAGAEVVARLGTSDDRESLRQALERAVRDCDVLLLAGGMSVGKHDFARPVLEELGMKQVFWGVDLRPGKPFLFGMLAERPVFGFPGNPVSVFVSFLRFCLPALLAFQGADWAESGPLRVSCRLGVDVANRGSRPHWVRGVYEAEKGNFRPVGIQESHGIGGLAAANALLRVPGETEWAAQTQVEAVLLEGWTL
jgi:molybdopterin molybdotransferase